MLSYPLIDPVALQLGPLKIHWYGLMYLGGFVAAWWLANRRAARPESGWNPQQVSDLIFYCALGVVLGGRFGYVLFYNFDRFLADPLWLFAVWEGGMAFHGGLLGVITAIALFGRKYHKGFFTVADFVAPLVPIGLGLGRLGNFIGQELWGRPTDVAWGMIFPNDPLQLARHPSQLYQFALEGILLFALVLWFSSKPRPRWAVAGMFSLGYGCPRFFAEFFREPDAHLGFQALGWVTRGQILSVPMILIGLTVLFLAYKTSDKKRAGGLNR